MNFIQGTEIIAWNQVNIIHMIYLSKILENKLDVSDS